MKSQRDLYIYIYIYIFLHELKQSQIKILGLI